MRLPAKRSQTQTVAASSLNIITGLHPGAEVLAEPSKAAAVLVDTRGPEESESNLKCDKTKKEVMEED